MTRKAPGQGESFVTLAAGRNPDRASVSGVNRKLCEQPAADQSPPVLLYVVNVSWFFLSHRLPLAVRAKRLGYEVHLATHVASAGDREAARAAGIQVHDLAIGRSEQGVLNNLTVLADLYRLYRRLAPDLVHHVTMKPVILGGIGARLAHVKSVVSAIPGLGYAFVADGWIAAARRILLRSGLRLALGHRNSVAIFQNPDDMGELVNAGVADAARCVLIRGSGVDTRMFITAPEPSGIVRVLLAARMLREKGVETFVEAARILQQRGIAVEFQLAGEPDPGNPGSLSESQLREWDSSGVVRWLGHQKDMVRVLSAVHIVCLPSYGEGVPKVLIEAAASGRAIVATDMPGCREIVRHEFNGLLVPPKNAPALADAISTLAQDDEKRRLFGRRGRQLAETEFDVIKVVDETMRVYERLRERAALQG